MAVAGPVFSRPVLAIDFFFFFFLVTIKLNFFFVYCNNYISLFVFSKNISVDRSIIMQHGSQRTTSTYRCRSE